MFRTIRSRNRRIVPAILGSAAIVAAAFLMQSTSGSSNSSEPQLAVAQRTADLAASRGGERSDSANALADQIAAAAQNGEFGSPSDAPDATTTTTTPPTTVPPTTAAPKPAPAPKPAAKPQPKPTPKATPPATAAPVADTGATSICAMSPGTWCSLAKCESGDRNVNTGNGYYGYFQFSAQTWKAMGGTGLPHQNSAARQLELAQKLQARSGWGQWPHCGARL